MKRVQAIIVYQFSDVHILWEALQGPGSPIRLIRTRRVTDGNKRLALIGDSILTHILREDWYNSGELRGNLFQSDVMCLVETKESLVQVGSIVSSVASNANLNRVGQQHGLQNLIYLGPSPFKAASPGTVATTVEAIIGAVYLDGGAAKVKKVLRTLGLVATEAEGLNPIHI